MHVMFVPSWYSNPRNLTHGSFFKEQALALVEEGVNISIAYNEIWPLPLILKNKEKIGLYYNLEDNLKTYRYKNYNYLPKNKNMFYSFNKRLEKLYKEIVKKEGKVDIIHAQSSFWGGISAAYVAKKYNIPLIITEHSSFKTAIYIKDSYKHFIINSYRDADKLIAVSNSLKNELNELTHRDDIGVISNLIDLEDFNIEIKKEDSKDFTFFTLAYLEGDKGMDTLIKAFSRHALESDNSKLIIGGEGSQRNYLENLAKELNIEDKITFKGALSRKEVAIEMNSCDAFVLASNYETFGVVYVEALACGKPIIGTKNGGAEYIINSENGLIVDKKNEEALKEALNYLKENINKYNSENIKEDCRKKYSKKVIANKIIKEYKELLAGKDKNEI